ncbi:MAG: NUDIX hydrolase [Bacteroidales bacterium]|nr:NUDIX hydrolase [Bacteroidales bacterium]
MEQKYCYTHPRPAVTVDCVVLSPEGGQMQVLLIERAMEPYKGQWAFPGGFMNIDESAEAAARRELREETGIAVGQMMQVGTYTRPDRDPRDRVISIAYVAYFDKRPEAVAADDAAKAQWFPVTQLPPLAFDHAEILRDVQELISPE